MRIKVLGKQDFPIYFWLLDHAGTSCAQEKAWQSEGEHWGGAAKDLARAGVIKAAGLVEISCNMQDIEYHVGKLGVCWWACKENESASDWYGKNIHQHRCFCQRQEDKRSRVSGSSWNNEWEDEVLREVAGQWTSTSCGSFSTHVETNWGFIQAFNNHKFIQTLINHFFLPTSWNSLLHLSPFPCRPVQAAANAFMASTRPKKSSKTAAKAKAKANKGTESGTKGKWERGQVGRVHWMDNWFTNEFMILGGLNKWYHLLLIILGLGLQECFFNPTEFVFYRKNKPSKKNIQKIK